MNESFETIRKELKKFNAEDNQPPPKLVIAGKNDLLDIEHRRKKNSQFIISLKEFYKSEQHLLGELLKEIEIRSGKKPLTFFYDNKEIIKTVIDDFEDYYNVRLGKNLYQKIGSINKPDDVSFCLVIIVIETEYYSS
jgi:hypothetical protein